MQIRDNVATVTVDTNGLLRAVHLMHIHAGTGTCPSASDAGLFNGHRFVSASEGDNSYGPVVTSLTVFGDTSPQSHLASARFPTGGNIRYKRAIALAPGVGHFISQGLAVIVVHGINYDGSGVYDNYLGADAEAGAPALCGVLLPASSASAGQSSSGTIYTASLTLYGGSPTQQSPSPVLLCHLGPLPVARPATTAG